MINLGFDFFPLVFFQRRNVDFVIEVTDVTHDSLVFHRCHVVVGNDVEVACRGHENVCFVGSVIHCHHAVAFHCRLQCANWVDFCHPNLCRQSTQRLRRTFTHVAITCNHRDFARDHYVGSAFDTVNQRFAAAVQVVEFGFGYGVIDVNRWEFQLAACVHLVQTVYARGGFFGYTAYFCQTSAVPVRGSFQTLANRGVQEGFFFRSRVCHQSSVLFRTRPQMQ